MLKSAMYLVKRGSTSNKTQRLTRISRITWHWLLPLLPAHQGFKSDLRTKNQTECIWTLVDSSAIGFDSLCCLQEAQRHAAGFLFCHQRHPGEQQEALIVWPSFRTKRASLDAQLEERETPLIGNCLGPTSVCLSAFYMYASWSHSEAIRPNSVQTSHWQTSRPTWRGAPPVVPGVCYLVRLLNSWSIASVESYECFWTRPAGLWLMLADCHHW